MIQKLYFLNDDYYMKLLIDLSKILVDFKFYFQMNSFLKSTKEMKTVDVRDADLYHFKKI